MLLKDLIEKEKNLISNVLNFANFEIDNVSDNSKQVDSKTIFICRKGTLLDGHDFVEDAYKNGTRVFVVSQEIITLPDDVVVIHTSDIEKLLLNILKLFYNIENIKLFAVTGTNGKTSVVYFVKQMFDIIGISSAYLGTIGIKGGLENQYNKKLALTTPGIIELYKELNLLSLQGINNVAMEVSSHAIDQERIKGLEFCVKAFCNLSQDHLDYHSDLQDYYQCKKSFFSQVNCSNIDKSNTDKNKAKSKKETKGFYNCLPVINRINDFANRLFKELEQEGNYKELLSVDFDYHSNEPTIEIFKLVSTQHGIDLSFTYLNQSFNLSLPFYGLFQVENILLAVLMLSAVVDKNKILKICQNLNKLQPPSGRLEVINHVKNNFTCIVDYAHTPDALKMSLLSLKKHGFKNLITVFGCGGNRDKGKRPVMGNISSKLSDMTIVTDDNPRNENRGQIRKEIIGSHKDFIEIADRREAIEYALSQAKQGDVVLIAGKGHEDYQLISGEKKQFSDKVTALAFLQRVVL